MGSLLLHAAVIWSLPARVTVPSLAPQQSSFIELESVERAALGHAPAITEPEAARREPPRARAVVAAVERRDDAPAAHGSTTEPLESPAPEPAAIAASAPLQPRAPIDLSPRAAALSAMPDQPSSASPAPLRAADDLARRRSDELSASLGAAARAEAERLRAPRQLELRREPDGTCHYAGTAIDATILADGGVVFSDKGPQSEVRWGVDEPAERVYSPDDAVAPQRLELGMRVVPRASHAERTWFLRETEQIRQELADAAREEELRAADRRLRAQLDRIWCDERRSKPERRRAIYALWADMSAGDSGPRGRSVVVDYVRRNLPAGSSDAFTSDELSALAALSGGAPRFDPYASGGSLDASIPVP